MAEQDTQREMLEDLNGYMTRCLADRDQNIARTRAYWDDKPRTMLNENLERIEIDCHHARYTLATADIKRHREQIIDVMSQIEMAKPIVFATNA